MAKTNGDTRMETKVPNVETLLCPAWTDGSTTHTIGNVPGYGGNVFTCCLWCMVSWADLDEQARHG